MLVINIFKILKFPSLSIKPIKYFSTKINIKEDFPTRNAMKLFDKCHSNDNDKYNECIKYGLTPNAILSNKWLYDMHISK